MKHLGLIIVLVMPLLIGAALVGRGVQEGAAALGTLDRPISQSTKPSALCAPLDPPTGPTSLVSTVAQLQDAVNNASPGDTILIADGTYNLDGVYLRLDTPSLTLRSASGDREAVILDGNYITTEIVQVAASNVTIADVTLREAYYHPIHVMSATSTDTVNTLIYNVHIIDPGEQAVKINPTGSGYYPDDGIIACSHIELTDVGRTQIRNNCYTGGIDAHQAEGWIIQDNQIEGFWCQSGLSEHAIHLWRGSRDTLVERNVLIDNARGIGFGLATSGAARTYSDTPCPGASGGYVDHYGGVIRNNFVFAQRGSLFDSQYGFDCGICLWQACEAQVFHNSVVSTRPPFSSIEWRFDNTSVEIKNNLVSHNLRDRGGSASLAQNLENVPLTLFVDGPNGDLHLRAPAGTAIDQAVPLVEVTDDIDGDGRPIGPAPDIGADEYGVPPPTAVGDLRVTTAISSTSVLTFTLGWSPPANAVTVTIRCSAQPITLANWAGASLLVGELPGNAVDYSGTIPYAGSTQYFALLSQNTIGTWSGISNNAFWPSRDVYLPLVAR